jgi:hypothetical protein
VKLSRDEQYIEPIVHYTIVVERAYKDVSIPN